MKFAVVAPAATVTDDGTVNAALFEERPTEAPPVGAARDIVTVQEEVPPDPTEFGVQDKPEADGGVTVITPLVPVNEIQVPSGKAPMTPDNGIGTDMALRSVRFAVTVATTVPLGIAVPFIPLTMQFSEFVPEWHDRVFPKPVKADPGTAVSETISVGK